MTCAAACCDDLGASGAAGSRRGNRRDKTLRERLEQKLEELKREFEIGQTRLRELEAQQSQLRETLLRISGAIQILEESLTDVPTDEVNPQSASH
jgi:predicted nuclease with TOPRIM domain